MKPSGPGNRPGASRWVPQPRPPDLDARPESRRVLLDVREDIEAGREPFGQIMGALDGLPPDGVLVLRAPFEPVPLYGVLQRRGAAYWTEWRGPRDWAVWIYHPSPEAAPGSHPGPRAGPEADPREHGPALDVRGLPPPLPMVRVLEALETLPAGRVLEVIHDRRPLLLYPQLDDRGFEHQTDEPEPGVVRIRAWRRPDGP